MYIYARAFVYLTVRENYQVSKLLLVENHYHDLQSPYTLASSTKRRAQFIHCFPRTPFGLYDNSFPNRIYNQCLQTQCGSLGDRFRLHSHVCRFGPRPQEWLDGPSVALTEGVKSPSSLGLAALKSDRKARAFVGPLPTARHEMIAFRSGHRGFLCIISCHVLCWCPYPWSLEPFVRQLHIAQCGPQVFIAGSRSAAGFIGPM